MKTKPWFNSRMLAALGLVMLLILAACGQEPRLPDTVDPGTPPAVTGVSVTLAQPTIAVGEQTVATATVTAAGGASRAVSWTSSNPDVATVDAAGNVRGVGEGTANIRATSDFDPARTGAATVTVTPAPVGPVDPVDPTHGAYYRGADGQLVRITDEDIDAGRFVFMTWLENEAGGVDITQGVITGTPTPATGNFLELGEMSEFAPSRTQNLAVAYMGYVADDGTVYPVVGATVRWTIDPNWFDPFNFFVEETGIVFANTIDFGSTADGGNNCGFVPSPNPEINVQCIDNNQADTTTKSGTVRNPVRFPVMGENYPFYNVTGINTPDTDGLSWVTLYSPETFASARVRVVGYVNGVEVDKHELIKRFAPQPELQITKTVNVTEVEAGDPVVFTVTVENVGEADAFNVLLEDRPWNDSTFVILEEVDVDFTADDDDLLEPIDYVGVVGVDAIGFDALFNLSAGEAVTFTFTAVSEEVDVFCNIATVVSGEGTFGQPIPGLPIWDTACVGIVAPELQIVKTNAPQTVNPGGDYTSTITVTNVGNATARGVIITDRIGLGPNNTYVEYVSSNLDGTPGTYNPANQTVTFPARDIAAGASVTVTVTQRVPDGALPGQYCDIAAYTSINAGQDQVEACIIVTAFAARQTQMVDDPDPVFVDEELTYTSAMYVEPRSNVGVYANEFDFSFGVVDPTAQFVNGVFSVDHARTQVYYLVNPPRDPVSGQVSMAPGAAGATLLGAGDYTLTTTAQGRQVITMRNDFVIAPNSVIYVRHFVTVPATVAAGDYNSTYTWTSTRQEDNVRTSVFSSEPTSVQAP